MTSLLSAWNGLDEARHRAEFYRTWRAGQSAGFTIPRSMELMGPRENAQVEAARVWVHALTGRGEDVSQAVKKGGTRFDEFERTLLTLGDQSGTLDQSLRLLADFFTRKHRMVLAVRKKMAYPLYTTFFAIFIAPFPLLFFGHSLAYFTIVIAGVASLLLFSGSLVMTVAHRYGRAPRFVRARLARALTTAIEAGLPLGQSVRLAGNASADRRVQEWMARIDEVTLASQPIVSTLTGCPHITPDFLAVLATAERTGDFNTSMKRLAELYEDGFR